MPISYRELVVLAGVETDYNDDTALTGGANAILMKDVTITPMQAQAAQRNIARPFYGAAPDKLYGFYASISGRIDFVGSGNPIVAPAYLPLLRAGGLAATICSGAAATIKNKRPGTPAPTGTFTYAATSKFNGTRKRTVTLTCTTAGGSGVAAFTVSAPAAGNQTAYNQTGVVMTDATPFALGGGATITPTIGTAFVLADVYTIEVWPERTELTPVSSGLESMALWCHLGPWLHKMPGARCNIQFEIRNGIPDWIFTINGLFVDPDDAALPSADFSAFLDPDVAELRNTPHFSLNGVDGLVLDNLSLNFNNRIDPRIKVNSEEIRYKGRSISASMLIDAVDKATLDPYALAKSGLYVPLELQHGTQAGRIVCVETQRLQLGAPGYQNDDDDTQWPLSGKLVPSDAGNDEILIYTA